MNSSGERRPSQVLETLQSVAKRWSLQWLTEAIDDLNSDRSVQIGFLGDFSSGKSTLINELTGVDDLMPVAVEPTTVKAGQVMSIPDLRAPRFFREDPNGHTTPISRPEFDSLTRGRTEGRPVVHLPSRPGFPAGFVFLDTPGLSSLIEEHTEVTVGQLPFVDAAVICVDIRKGGLTNSVTTFLQSPGIRHLQHLFLIALTFADRLSGTERKEVSDKVAATLSPTIGCSESEAGERIVVVSAGPDAANRDVSALRTAINEVFESRKESLSADRQRRAAVRLVPRTIELLEHRRDGLLEPDESFARRKGEADSDRTRLDDALRRERDRLGEVQGRLRLDVQEICDRFRGSFEDATDDDTLNEVGAAFTEEINDAVRGHLERYGQGAAFQVRGLDEGIKRAVRGVNTVAGFAAMITTGALLGIVSGGVGGAAGAGGHAVARKTAAGAAAASARAGQAAAAGAGAASARNVLAGFLTGVHKYNPVNMVADFIGGLVKRSRIEYPLERVAERLSRTVEIYFESEVFQPLERQIDEVHRVLSELETERRADLEARTAKVSRIDADIATLRRATASTSSQN